MDRFNSYPNVKTVLVKAPHKLFWDQIAIPLAVHREKIELVFHLKHFLPILVNCK